MDGEALRQQVLGLPEDEARAILEPYGEVELVLWPGFVTSVPTLEQRVTLVVADAVDPTPDIAPVPADAGAHGGTVRVARRRGSQRAATIRLMLQPRSTVARGRRAPRAVRPSRSGSPTPPTGRPW